MTLGIESLSSPREQLLAASAAAVMGIVAGDAFEPTIDLVGGSDSSM